MTELLYVGDIRDIENLRFRLTRDFRTDESVKKIGNPSIPKSKERTDRINKHMKRVQSESI